MSQFRATVAKTAPTKSHLALLVILLRATAGLTALSARKPGSCVSAYLLILKDVRAGKQKALAILCLPGTANDFGPGEAVIGLGKANRGYALALAQRGYITLAPNYPLLAKYQPDLNKLGQKQ